jgi:hypothetical protein
VDTETGCAYEFKVSGKNAWAEETSSPDLCFSSNARVGIALSRFDAGSYGPLFVSGLHDAMAYRVAHQACDLVNTQLVHESRAVRFGCFHTDAE